MGDLGEQPAVLRLGHQEGVSDSDFLGEMQAAVTVGLHSEVFNRVQLTAEDFTRLVGMVGLKAANDDTEPVSETSRLFSGSPETVASELISKSLVVGNRRAIILHTQPQTAEDNSKFIGKEPLFTDDPVDVYVAAVRGKHILFLRSGDPYTCVRVTSVQVGRKTYETPTEVCKALGLDRKATGNYLVENGTVFIDLDEPK